MGEVMMWLNPKECVLEASWLSVWPVWIGNTFFKVHGTLKQKEKKQKP